VNRPNLDVYFMRMLRLVASRSTCSRRKVGAIITDNKGHVLSMGYNGVVSGATHCTDEPCAGALDKSGDSSRCQAVHAEMNAVLQCRAPERAAVIYTSTFPCFTCAKVIVNVGITRVVFEEDYPDTLGKELLWNRGISVVHMAVPEYEP